LRVIAVFPDPVAHLLKFCVELDVLLVRMLGQSMFKHRAKTLDILSLVNGQDKAFASSTRERSKKHLRQSGFPSEEQLSDVVLFAAMLGRRANVSEDELLRVPLSEEKVAIGTVLAYSAWNGTVNGEGGHVEVWICHCRVDDGHSS
jgi:hypothetical protein